MTSNTRPPARFRSLSPSCRPPNVQLSPEECARIILNGVSGCNKRTVAREAFVSQMTVAKFLRGGNLRPEYVERIELFIWRQLNRHVLLGEEDLK